MDGRKDDKKKLRMELLPSDALRAIADILTRGAVKYGERNWEKGMSWSRIYGALQRHLTAWEAGEECDEETGKSHLWHAGCCVLFLISYEARDIGKDDRPAVKTRGKVVKGCRDVLFDAVATGTITLDDLEDAEQHDLFDKPVLTPHGRRIDLGSGLFADAEDFANRRYLGLPVKLYGSGGTLAGSVDGPCSKQDYERYLRMEYSATGVLPQRIVAHASIHPGIR